MTRTETWTPTQRLDRLERVLVGVADALAQMSGRTCLRFVAAEIDGLRVEIEDREDG